MKIIKKIASLYRKKENSNIEINESALAADGKPIQDEDIPYLMQRDTERALAKEKEKKQVFTAYELRLAENFELNHFDGYSELEFKLMDLEVDVKNEKNLSKKIELLETVIATYEKLKKFCRSKGKGGTIYFQIEWESKPFFSEMQKELEDAKQKLDIN